MNYYGEKEVANVLHLLDKMRNEYPKEEEKYKYAYGLMASSHNFGYYISFKIVVSLPIVISVV